MDILENHINKCKLEIQQQRIHKNITAQKYKARKLLEAFNKDRSSMIDDGD